MAKISFNAANVEPAKPMEPVPTGWYVCLMTESETTTTSKGDGSMLSITYTIQSPEQYKGRKLFDRLNIENPNPHTVEIAYQQLSAICHAVGVIQIEETSQLHNRPLQVRAVLRAAGPGADGKHYEASNEVRGYKAIETGEAAAIAAPVIPTAGSALPPPVVQAQASVTAPNPVAPPPPTPVAEPVLVGKMTAKANGATFEQFIESGWSKEKMIEEGYYEEKADWTEAPKPPAAPTAPAAPAGASAADKEVVASAASGATPPWAKK